MFTPPPSPLPSAKTQFFDSPEPDSNASSNLLTPPSSTSSSQTPSSLQSNHQRAVSVVASHEVKKKTARRIRWTILLVPAVLVLITASTRYLSHPAALDIFSAHRHPDFSTWTSSLADWKLHKHKGRHKRSPAPYPQDSSVASSSSPIVFPSSVSLTSISATPTSTTVGSLPTIPSSPPVLPTPFPQPFDTTLEQNFSTQGCSDFFINMTEAAAFRSCRPFSLLMGESSAFIEAQNNITALNAIVWGTCNTTIDADQCDANMASFASQMQNVCSKDLSNQNQMVTSALNGLQTYSMIRTAGCLADQTADTYCYIDAVSNSNPSDLYFYSLPLGTELPNSTTPTCSACTKSLMKLYAEQKGNMSTLEQTYAGAAAVAQQVCGSDYIDVASSGAVQKVGFGWGVVLGLLGMIAAMTS